MLANPLILPAHLPRYGTFCSGIEAVTVAWEDLGWHAAFFSEIDRFPCAVLKTRHPNVPNLGDMTAVDGKALRGLLDIIVAGTPCQSFSIAGLRTGLEDERGNLTLELVKIYDSSKTAYLLWENVPGVLSDRGNAFGCFLGALSGENEALLPPGGKWTDAGYVLGPQRAIAWRILDAQYFGLAQRRKRVFLIACPRDGADPRQILFESHGMRRDTPPGRETGAGVAGTLDASFGRSRGAGQNPSGLTQALTGRMGGGGPDDNKAQGGFYVADIAPTLRAGGNNTGGDRPVGMDVDTCESLVGVFGGNNTAGAISVSPALNAHGGGSRRMDFESEAFIAHTLRAEGFDASEDGTGRANLVVTPINTQVGLRHKSLGERTGLGIGNHGDPAFTLQAGHHHAIAFHGSQDPDVSGDVTHPLGRNQGREACLFQYSAVRRLTPRECERLQGFPDDYTLISYRGKPATDGPRYKALGNSMAVPVMRWLGARLKDAILEVRS